MLNRSGRWACLMYHEIPPGGDAGYFGVPQARFGAHLDELRKLDRRGVALEEALDSPDKTGLVAVTFDDGHHTHYEQAFPLLRARGMAATFFVTTDWVGRKGYVTWPQLREMAAGGMSIQSHTASHPFLSELDRAGVERELKVSKDLIEQRTGQRCRTIALPGGDPPTRWTSADYPALGFSCVATSRWGPNNCSSVAGRAIPIRRYTVRRDTPDKQLRRLALAHEPVYAIEGIRLAVLNVVRASFGASRYARWRRRTLDLLMRH